MTNTKQIEKRIQSMKPGTAFIASDFFDLSDYENVRKILNRLTDAKKIRRLLPGVYDAPRYSKLLIEWEAPNLHEVALALARKYNWSIAPTGNTALNVLGLSTQVPGKWMYISDGRYVTYNVAGTLLEFKHRANGEISGLSKEVAMVIQAIQAIGKDQMTEESLKILRDFLSDSERQELLIKGKATKSWVYQIIREIGAAA
ncbi:MAG: DUF6088 family protein [Oscillospiraceae bacterium]|nr:DUF6088 family protein [Oscillospiraceae bacterium]